MISDTPADAVHEIGVQQEDFETHYPPDIIAYAKAVTFAMNGLREFLDSLPSEPKPYEEDMKLKIKQTIEEFQKISK